MEFEINSSTRLHFPIILEKDEDGIIVASCPTLAGCHTQGRTVEEAMQNIYEAILLCLESFKANPL